MVTIKEDATFTQIVTFDVDPDDQAELIAAIANEVERWVRHRPGFVSSALHASQDGRHVVNYAQWTDEASFRSFTEDPETVALRAAIHRVDDALEPHAIHCRVSRCIER